MGGVPGQSARAYLGIIVMVCVLVGAAAARAQDSDTTSEDFAWFTWHDPFGECAGNCAVAGYFGNYVETLGLDLGFRGNNVPIKDWEWGDGQLLAIAASRRLVTLADVIDIEPEFGIGKRFGNMNEWEFWSAFWFRWTWFPWNEYLSTTAAVSTGLSYATGISGEERNLSGNKEGSRLLHFLSAEITFALPNHLDWELLVRFHHRSGGQRFKWYRGVSDALFNSTFGGAHYGAVGLRKRF